MEDRICASCHGRVSAIDVACRHCGSSFRGEIKPRGSFMNDFFRIALGVWALALPGWCLYVTVATPQGWGSALAYFLNNILFVPWITVTISLGVMVWLTQERR